MKMYYRVKFPSGYLTKCKHKPIIKVGSWHCTQQCNYFETFDNTEANCIICNHPLDSSTEYLQLIKDNVERNRSLNLHITGKLYKQYLCIDNISRIVGGRVYFPKVRLYKEYKKFPKWLRNS